MKKEPQETYATRYSLINRIKATNDEKAWEEFTEHYKPFIFFLLQKMRIEISEQDDLFQEILIHLFKKLDHYIEQKGKFRSWLGVVIKNTSINYINKHNNANTKKEKLFEVLKEVNSYETPKLESIIQQEWQNYTLETALKRLEGIFDSNIIECFKMTMADKSADEIAEKLNIQVASVYVLRNRIKKRLVDEMKKISQDLEF